MCIPLQALSNHGDVRPCDHRQQLLRQTQRSRPDQTGRLAADPGGQRSGSGWVSEYIVSTYDIPHKDVRIAVKDVDFAALQQSLLQPTPWNLN